MTQSGQTPVYFTVMHRWRLLRFSPRPVGYGMKRREFITLVSGAVAAWPFIARAQQPDRVRVIGALFDLMDNTPVAQSYFGAFRDELAKLGWKGQQSADRISL